MSENNPRRTRRVLRPPATRNLNPTTPRTPAIRRPRSPPEELYIPPPALRPPFQPTGPIPQPQIPRLDGRLPNMHEIFDRFFPDDDNENENNENHGNAVFFPENRRIHLRQLFDFSSSSEDSDSDTSTDENTDDSADVRSDEEHQRRDRREMRANRRQVIRYERQQERREERERDAIYTESETEDSGSDYFITD